MTDFPFRDPTRLLADMDFVRSLARQLCSNAQTAEDVAQATLATAIERPPTKPGNWRGWLATATSNLARKHYRNERRLKSREARTANAATAPSTAEVVAREELRSQVVQAVLGLPDPYRKIVLLHHFNGLDMAACAASLDIPPSTARTHLSRAIERLRQQLDKQHHGDRQAWVTALLPFAMPTVAATVATKSFKTAIASILAAATLAIGLLIWSATQAQSSSPDPMASSHIQNATVASSTGASNPQLPNLRNEATSARDEPAAPATPWLLRGRVTNTLETAVDGAEVRAWATIGQEHMGRTSIAIKGTQSDHAGNFEMSLEPLQALSSLAQSQVHLYVAIDAVGYSREMRDITLSDHLAEPADEVLSIEISEEALLKGRVVTSDGEPLAETIVWCVSNDGSQSATSHRDGYFEISPMSAGNADSCLLFAAHTQFGRSEPRLLRPNPHAEVRTPDLVIQAHDPSIEGHICLADGQPAAEMEVVIRTTGDQPPDIAEFDGIKVEDFHWLLHSHDNYRVMTDATGRFVFHNARAGLHELEIDGTHKLAVDVMPGPVVTRVDYRYLGFPTDAVIAVRVEDTDGTWLPEANFGFHRWQGAAASLARARFHQEGATPQLLATAQSHESMFDGRDSLLNSRQDTFHVFEASCQGAGPTYAECSIQPNQNRSDVTIVLSATERTGKLHIDSRGPDDRQLQLTWVRMSRGQTLGSMPVLLTGNDTRMLPPSNILGPWHRLPQDGLLRDLPTGPLTIEVMSLPLRADGEVMKLPYPIQTHQIIVPRSETASLVCQHSKGTPLRIELRMPTLRGDERIRTFGTDVRFFRNPEDNQAGFQLVHEHGSHRQAIEQGRSLLRSHRTFLPGSYQLQIRPSVLIEQLVPAGGSGETKWQHMSHQPEWCDVDQVVTIKPDMQPIVIQIARR